MDFVIITGMSGSGKSRAIAAMEDIGYYCVDNLPPKMVKSFTALCLQAAERVDKVAVVIDARSCEVFGDLFEGIEELMNTDSELRILFLDCDDNVLIQRYKETRRRHPLMDEQCCSIEEAVTAERHLLERLRSCADYLVDTSLLSTAQLREKIVSIFLEHQNQAMLVQAHSFGFKYGIPKEADLVFDVRCLPNPFYVPELKRHTGLEEPVRTYVLQWEQARTLLEKLMDLIDYLVPLYQSEGKTQLNIAIGCTGGKHRSVVFAQEIGQHLQGRACHCVISHRDIEK